MKQTKTNKLSKSKVSKKFNKNFNKNFNNNVKRSKNLQLKKIKKTKKGGCKWNFLDSDDVWERMNGIISGRIYNIMQYYGLTDANTCIQMEKLGTKLKSKKAVSDLGSLTEIANGALTKAFTGYILYDSTKNIKNSIGKNENKSDIDSSSFLIGKVKIIGDKVVFYQHEQDKKDNESLIFETDLNRSVYVKVIPDKHKKYKDIDKVTKEIFFFTLKDAEWSTIKPGWRLPTNYINDIQKKLRESRQITEPQQTTLTQGQTREQKIQSNIVQVGTNKGNTTITQKGGDKSIYTIPNNGIEDKMNSQCIWIVIKDYLNYHRGETHHTVFSLKSMIGLNDKTDTIEYDLEDPKSKDKIDELCKILNIRLNTILMNDRGYIKEALCLDDNGDMLPRTIINFKSSNDVYIATFGNHLELIIKGPKYGLEKDTKSSFKPSDVNIFKPKAKIGHRYVNPDDLKKDDERDLAGYSFRLINTKLDILFFENEIKELPSITQRTPQESELVSGYKIKLQDLRSSIPGLEVAVKALSELVGSNSNA